MDMKMDSVVKVSVVDATSAVAQTNINTAAVVAPASSDKSGAVAAAKVSQDDVETAYGDESGLASLSASFFAQESHPDELVCVPGEPTADNVASLLDGAAGMDFYHVVLRPAASMEKDDVVKLVVALDKWCSANLRFAHVELADRTLAMGVVKDETYAALASKRVAVYFHSETSGSSFAAALVASRCAADPARGTWAHKTPDALVADALSVSDFSDAKKYGLNVFTTLGGTKRSFFGFAGAATLFVDQALKKDWVRFRVQERIYDLLGNANDGDGVDYDDSGIQAVGGAVSDVLAEAADAGRRYIMDGSWAVSTPKFSEIEAAKKAKRVLPDISAEFSLMNSIHTVETVRLVVAL